MGTPVDPGPGRHRGRPTPAKPTPWSPSTSGPAGGTLRWIGHQPARPNARNRWSGRPNPQPSRAAPRDFAVGRPNTRPDPTAVTPGLTARTGSTPTRQRAGTTRTNPPRPNWPTHPLTRARAGRPVHRANPERNYWGPYARPANSTRHCCCWIGWICPSPRQAPGLPAVSWNGTTRFSGPRPWSTRRAGGWVHRRTCLLATQGVEGPVR